MINLATFNLFWFPESTKVKSHRSAADFQLIQRVLKNLNAHALVFQEILDRESLQALLGQVEGHRYCMRRQVEGECEGDWLSSGNWSMKIACAYDADVLELVDAATLDNPEPYPGYSGRDPYAMHLRERTTGAELTFVGVHMKSESPGVENPVDPAGKDIRELEAGFLARWLAGELEIEQKNPNFNKPPTERVVVMGDFNALVTLSVLSPLRQGAMAGWDWPECAIVESPASGRPVHDEWGAWTTYLDMEVIDHALVSPALKPHVDAALIYAFDLDPSLDEPEHPAGWLRQRTDYKLIPSTWKPLQVVHDFYRVSDHRPVRISIAPGL